MNKLNLLKNKLNKLGYSVFIKDEKFIKGGYSGDDLEKSLSIDINVYIENDSYIFIDWNKQLSTKKTFSTMDETVNYIKEKYPI